MSVSLISNYLDDVITRRQAKKEIDLAEPIKAFEDCDFEEQLAHPQLRQIPFVSQLKTFESQIPQHSKEKRKILINDVFEYLAKDDPTFLICRLQEEGIDDYFIGRLARAMRRNTCLQELYAQGNYVTDAGLEKLAASVAIHPSLVILAIGSNPIGDVGAETLARMLETQPNPPLRDLNISTKWPNESWSNAERLMHRHITSVGVVSIARSLKSKNTTLLSLSLANQRAGDLGAVALFDALIHNPSLQSLNLSDNDVSTHCCAVLGNMLSRNGALQRIDISKNRIDGEGAYYIAEGLSNNNSLISLDLSHNLINDQGAEALSLAVMEYNWCLQHLSLAGNPTQNDNAECVVAHRRMMVKREESALLPPREISGRPLRANMSRHRDSGQRSTFLRVQKRDITSTPAFFPVYLPAPLYHQNAPSDGSIVSVKEATSMARQSMSRGGVTTAGVVGEGGGGGVDEFLSSYRSLSSAGKTFRKGPSTAPSTLLTSSSLSSLDPTSASQHAMLAGMSESIRHHPFADASSNALESDGSGNDWSGSQTSKSTGDFFRVPTAAAAPPFLSSSTSSFGPRVSTASSSPNGRRNSKHRNDAADCIDDHFPLPATSSSYRPMTTASSSQSTSPSHHRQQTDMTSVFDALDAQTRRYDTRHDEPGVSAYPQLVSYVKLTTDKQKADDKFLADRRSDDLYFRVKSTQLMLKGIDVGAGQEVLPPASFWVDLRRRMKYRYPEGIDAAKRKKEQDKKNAEAVMDAYYSDQMKVIESVLGGGKKVGTGMSGGSDSRNGMSANIDDSSSFPFGRYPSTYNVGMSHKRGHVPLHTSESNEKVLPSVLQPVTTVASSSSTTSPPRRSRHVVPRHTHDSSSSSPVRQPPHPQRHSHPSSTSPPHPSKAATEAVADRFSALPSSSPLSEVKMSSILSSTIHLPLFASQEEINRFKPGGGVR